MPGMDRPLLVTEWSKHLRSQKAQRAAKSFELVLASIEVDAALARTVKVRRSKGRVELVGKGNLFKARVFPPAVKSVSLARAKRVEFQEPPGLRPKHLDFRARPNELPNAFRQVNRIRRYDLEVGRIWDCRPMSFRRMTATHSPIPHSPGVHAVASIRQRA